ncbi:MAG: hypothetical protein IT245_02195 [Bacteroidia bacterium]|nr:hypothetical protein [Bacteroidia bacterium]
MIRIFKFKMLILGLLLILSTDSFSQNNYIEVIYLKNGSKIKGMITEFVPNVSYTITTIDGSIFVCSINDILKITKEPVVNPVVNQTKPNDSASTDILLPALEYNQEETFEKSYRGIVELGYGLKSGKYGLDVTNFNFINGYQFTQNIFAGIGTGFKYFNESETPIIPLFADFKYTFMQKNISPIFGFSAGFSFNPQDGFKGEGFLFNPSLGVQIQGKGNTRFNIGLNYQTQQLNFLVLSDDLMYFNNIIRFSESAGITLGLVF